MKKIFIINLGTTSFKFKFYQFEGNACKVLAGGEIESIGAQNSHYELYFEDGSRMTDMVVASGKTGIGETSRMTYPAETSGKTGIGETSRMASPAETSGKTGIGETCQKTSLAETSGKAGIGGIDGIAGTSGIMGTIARTDGKDGIAVITGNRQIADYTEAFSFCIKVLKENMLLKDFSELSAVGYKAVHGGRLSGTRVVDEELLAEMDRVTSLAPAHNPIYIAAMQDIRKKYPELLQVARFETSFHKTVPDYRTTYGVPYAWREDWGIQKYGFHGSSHEYIAKKVHEIHPEAQKIISCHLGGSSSLCAIRNGASIATSMGATVQSGLFHNNRVGDFEIFCLPLLLEHYGGNLKEVLDILSSQSGLLGLSGVSNDLRKVLDARHAGDVRADLAVKTLIDNIVGYIGMYTAYLEGLDALVFTGGIGLHSNVVRSMVCERLQAFGVRMDEKRNRSEDKKHSSDFREISAEDSRVRLYVIRTDEESIVAGHVYELLQSKMK